MLKSVITIWILYRLLRLLGGRLLLLSLCVTLAVMNQTAAAVDVNTVDLHAVALYWLNPVDAECLDATANVNWRVYRRVTEGLPFNQAVAREKDIACAEAIEEETGDPELLWSMCKLAANWHLVVLSINGEPACRVDTQLARKIYNGTPYPRAVENAKRQALSNIGKDE